MGSCAAPSAKGDDKFITTDYLQQCQWITFHPSLTGCIRRVQRAVPGWPDNGSRLLGSRPP
ncbi:TPA: hypothetical protein GE057_22460 [Escherichia coli]|nr:hypothetical protein [Escherichia coli]